MAHWVDRHPRKLWLAAFAALVAGAAFFPALQSKGVPLNELFVNDAPSVAAQETLGRHFPGGSGQPVVIIADAGRHTEAAKTAAKTPGSPVPRQ